MPTSRDLKSRVDGCQLGFSRCRATMDAVYAVPFDRRALRRYRHPVADWRTETLDSGPVGAGGGTTPALQDVLTAYVAAHPDVTRVGESTLLTAADTDAGALVSRISPDFSPPTRASYSPLGDPHLSRKPVVLRRRTSALEIDATGTTTRIIVGGIPVNGVYHVPWESLTTGIDVVLNDTVALWLVLETPAAAESQNDDSGLTGVSAPLRRVRAEILRVADTDLPVLLRGETGAGKEVVARAIHRYSKRRARQLVAVNMGSLGASLAASALFGHRRGAFSGATESHRGYFGQAEAGTLFLDEIGDTPIEVQVALLRAVETLKYRPLGGEKEIPANVRLIAATDRDLEAAVADGSFRAPLYHRLAGYVIDVPSLRVRRADIPVLLRAFVGSEAHALSEPPPQLGPDLVATMLRYTWPGNVRELRNAARQIVIASRGSATAIMPSNLARQLKPSTEAPALRQSTGAAPPPVARGQRRPATVTEDELIQTLAEHSWKIAPTAAALGIARASLYDLINRSTRIRKASELDRNELAEALARLGPDLNALSRELRVSPRGLLFRLRSFGLDAS